MKHFIPFIFSCILFQQNGFAQNLTGTWLGDDDYRIVIVQIGDSCIGYTYDTGMGFCQANFIGKYDASTKKLVGTNTSFIDRTLSHSLSNYKLNYSLDGGAEYLRGRGSVKSAMGRILTFGIGFPLSYKKISESFDTTQLMAARLQVQTPVARQTAADSVITVAKYLTPATTDSQELNRQKITRKSQLVNTIYTSADSLRLTLNDNGEIDNDTVTVFLNGKIIVNRLGLTARAHEIFIPLQQRDSVYSIELMANNLGSIPPNTAYLSIWAGKEKYELRVSSDYTVNARIDVHYRKEK